MRITEKQKQEVSARLLSQARILFRRRDPSAVSTRDVAAAAGIAHGTLFNYFPTKQALVLALVAEDLERGRTLFRARQRPEASLEEEIFALIAAELEALEGARRVALAALEVALSPLASAGGPAADLRAAELALVGEILDRHAGGTLRTCALHLYWSLYLGVLGFWATDSSPSREDTLALLDETTRLVAALVRGPAPHSGEEP